MCCRSRTCRGGIVVEEDFVFVIVVFVLNKFDLIESFVVDIFDFEHIVVVFVLVVFIVVDVIIFVVIAEIKVLVFFVVVVIVLIVVEFFIEVVVGEYDQVVEILVVLCARSVPGGLFRARSDFAGRPFDGWFFGFIRGCSRVGPEQGIHGG